MMYLEAANDNSAPGFLSDMFMNGEINFGPKESDPAPVDKPEPNPSQFPERTPNEVPATGPDEVPPQKYS